MHWNVSPRYTPGSPAGVSQGLAERVASQEQAAYLQTKSGVYGKEEQDRAERLGLDAIVEKRVECRWGWLVEDLITGKRFLRAFKCECGRDQWTLGWPEEARSREPHRRGCRAGRVDSAPAKRRLERWQLLGR